MIAFLSFTLTVAVIQPDVHAEITLEASTGGMTGYLDNDTNPTTGSLSGWDVASTAVDYCRRSVGMAFSIITEIDRIEITNDTNTSRCTASSYTIYWSNDNITYTQIPSFTFYEKIVSGKLVHGFKFNAVSVRYIKINTTYTDTAYTFTLTPMRSMFKAYSPSTKITVSKTTGYLDNDTNPSTGAITSWVDGNVAVDYQNRSIALDFGNKTNISEIEFYDADNSTRCNAMSYEFYWSDDNITYKKLLNVAFAERTQDGKKVHSFSFQAIKVQYIKIHTTHTDTNYTFALLPMQSNVIVYSPPIANADLPKTIGYLDNDTNPINGSIGNWNGGNIAVDYENRSIGLDFGISRSISEIELFDSDNYTRCDLSDYELYWSNDNASFTRITNIDFFERTLNGKKVHSFSFQGITARYIKIHTTYSDTAYTFALVPSQDNVNAYYVWGPENIAQVTQAGNSVITLPDGTMKYFFIDQSTFTFPGIIPGKWYSLTSMDGGLTWGGPEYEFSTPQVYYQGQYIDTYTASSNGLVLDANGEIHMIYQVVYGTNTGFSSLGTTFFMDAYHIRTTNGRTAWTASNPIKSGIFCGYIKAISKAQNGRLLATFGEWAVPADWANGWEKEHVYYSDNNGSTWTESSYADGIALHCPYVPNFNGDDTGACEGAFYESSQNNWTLLYRTQTGLFYVSTSTDNGSTWSLGVPSNVHSSDSNAHIINLSDGRTVMVWNNQPNLPRFYNTLGNLTGIYSGRDSLHAAISDDGGLSWKGFREVYLDPARNDMSSVYCDTGAAMPSINETANGKILCITGQDVAMEMILFDPDWLLETTQYDDFSNGLDKWSTYTAYDIDNLPTGLGQKPPRVEGARLIDHPNISGLKALFIRKAYTDMAADGANWNFPSGNGNTGTITMQAKFIAGFSGAKISLNDCFYDPWYTDGETNAIFTLAIDSNGAVTGGGQLSLNQWYTITLTWNLANGTCSVFADGTPLVTLSILNQPATGNPISYLRLKSAAVGTQIDHYGFVIESVSSNTN